MPYAHACLVISANLACLFLPASLAAREWSDFAGRNRIEAEFVEERDGKVVLQKADGTTVTVPLEKLSGADRQFVREATAPASAGADGFTKRSADSKGLSIGIKTQAELEQFAGKQPSVQSIIMLYKLFINDPGVADQEKNAARDRLGYWENLAKEGAVRIGRQWVTEAKISSLQRDEEQLLIEAFRMVELGNDKLAEEKFMAASKANPNGIRADFVLGLYYALKVRKAASAEQHFLECVKRRLPNAPSLDNEERANLMAALNNLALAEVRQRKYDSALKHWKASTEHAPPPPEMIQNVGRLAHLAEVTKTLGISKATGKSAALLYAEFASGTAARQFDPQTGWLYLRIFSSVKGAAAGSTPSPSPPPSSPSTSAVGADPPIVVATGSGFVIQPEYVITNRHVAAGADALVVVDGANPALRYDAQVVKISDTRDLALLKCIDLKAKPVPLITEPPRLASDVILLGYPETIILGTGLKATRGSISGLPAPETDHLLLFDAVANHGNSGGPVCDQWGRAVAVCSGVYNLLGKLSIGVPADQVLQFAKQHHPNFQEVSAASSPRDWADITEEVGAATVFIQILKRPVNITIPRNSSSAHSSAAEEPERQAYEDPWCMFCNGSGFAECPVRSCSRGTMPSESTHVVGVNPVSKERIVETVPTRVRCRTCNGKGKVNCTHCRGGIDPTVGGGRSTGGETAIRKKR